MVYLPTALKNNTKRFVIAVLLLLCFGTGQAIVLTHSHVAVATVNSKQAPSSNPDDNCKICQLSHSFTATLYSNVPAVNLYGTIYKQLQVSVLSYQNISQLLAATRGPPAV